MRRAPALVVAVTAALAVAPPVRAAAPRFILVSGAGVGRPVLLARWSENGALLATLVSARSAKPAVIRGLAKRPRLDLALFWSLPGSARPTRPSDASQHGWFYPARRGRAAIVDLQVRGVRIPRVAPRRFVQILARHRVPTIL